MCCKTMHYSEEFFAWRYYTIPTWYSSKGYGPEARFWALPYRRNVFQVDWTRLFFIFKPIFFVPFLISFPKWSHIQRLLNMWNKEEKTCSIRPETHFLLIPGNWFITNPYTMTKKRVKGLGFFAINLHHGMLFYMIKMLVVIFI